MGLMQLMPATAVRYGVSNPYDPIQNIRAGVAYLRSLLDRYSHNEELALAAYNAGPAAVEKYGAVPPYRETRDYVKKIRNDAGARPAPTRVYRVVELKDGREIVRYTNTPPQ
jgi:soluble lytic murein transglycosylase-like protein